MVLQGAVHVVDVRSKGIGGGGIGGVSQRKDSSGVKWGRVATWSDDSDLVSGEDS